MRFYKSQRSQNFEKNHQPHQIIFNHKKIIL